MPLCLSRFKCLICVPYLRALRALFAPFKTFLEWMYSPSQAFNFRRAIKGITNHAVFMRVEKQSCNFFEAEKFFKHKT